MKQCYRVVHERTHTDTPKTAKEIFVISLWLHGEPAQVWQPQSSQFFVFFAPSPDPGCPTTVDKKQNCRSPKARLVHLGTSLDFGTMDQVFDKLCLCYFLAGVGAQVLGFKVGMIEWCLQQGVSCAKIWGSVSRGKCVWGLNARRSHLDFLCRW